MEREKFKKIMAMALPILGGMVSQNIINLIDTAPWYGHGKSETVLGKALAGVPRRAYYLNTKVGRYDPEPDRMFDFTAARVTRSVDESLARLGCTYIDSVQPVAVMATSNVKPVSPHRVSAAWCQPSN